MKFEPLRKGKKNRYCFSIEVGTPLKGLKPVSRPVIRLCLLSPCSCRRFFLFPLPGVLCPAFYFNPCPICPSLSLSLSVSRLCWLLPLFSEFGRGFLSAFHSSGPFSSFLFGGSGCACAASSLPVAPSVAREESRTPPERTYEYFNPLGDDLPSVIFSAAFSYVEPRERSKRPVEAILFSLSSFLFSFLFFFFVSRLTVHINRERSRSFGYRSPERSTTPRNKYLPRSIDGSAINGDRNKTTHARGTSRARAPLRNLRDTLAKLIFATRGIIQRSPRCQQRFERNNYFRSRRIHTFVSSPGA